MAEKPIKTPLPADLPEDWNAGQIVAPDGTAAGLTEQHGYNYLMAAVNRAQRGVNEVNEAFETISAGAARFVVGTSTNGWTAADCDFLCDGTDDQVEIQQAIDAANAKGGEVLLLPGSYTLSGCVNVRSSVWLHGMTRDATEIKRGTADGGGETKSIIQLSQNSILSDFTFLNFSGVSDDTYDIVSEGGCQIQNISFPTVQRKSICIHAQAGGNIRISGCYWLYAETAVYVKGNDGQLFVDDNNFLMGDVFLQMAPGAAGSGGLLARIAGNRSGGAILLDGLSTSGGNIVIGNTCRILHVLNTQGKKSVNSGNLIAGNVFNKGTDGGDVAVTLGENTSGWFVTGNVLFEVDEEQDYLIQDLGVNNVVRFNSDDPGGSTPATVQQATPTITVDADGTVTARAAQAAGYVAAGTRSATHKLSSADDTDLAPENIKDGVSIFGVTGALQSGGGVAGVESFNGRTGAVAPASGDYTAEMVGARPSDWTPTAADVGAIPSGGIQEIRALTEAEYSALTDKNATTLYLIKE